MSRSDTGQETEITQWVGEDGLQNEDDSVYFPLHTWYDTTPCVRRVVEFPDRDFSDTTPCVRELTHDEKVHGIGHDWDALESAVRPITAFEKLVGYHVITEEQHEDTPRLVEDTGKETVRRAIEDGHDDSDYQTEVTH